MLDKKSKELAISSEEPHGGFAELRETANFVAAKQGTMVRIGEKDSQRLMKNVRSSACSYVAIRSIKVGRP